MNGHLADFLLWALGSAFGIVNVLFGLILWLLKAGFAAHKELDDERHRQMDKEVRGLRGRVHDAWNEIAALKAIADANRHK